MAVGLAAIAPWARADRPTRWTSTCRSEWSARSARAACCSALPRRAVPNDHAAPPRRPASVTASSVDRAAAWRQCERRLVRPAFRRRAKRRARLPLERCAPARPALALVKDRATRLAVRFRLEPLCTSRAARRVQFDAAKQPYFWAAIHRRVEYSSRVSRTLNLRVPDSSKPPSDE